MKKILIFLLTIIIGIIIIICWYSSYNAEYSQLMKENAEYEKYHDKEINGLEIATIINKTVDKNTKNQIAQDENGNFIQNDNNSIQIEIYMQDNETTYKMEQFYKTGIEQFVQYYGNIKFKCSKIEYHETTGKVRYILFEQLQTS